MKLRRLFRHLLATSWTTRRAFPGPALSRIEAAIGQSENRHGGQIRFVVEAALDPGSIWRAQGAADRALEAFSSLRVWDTENNNGVLVYLLLADHDVEIVADRGIHRHVGAPGWEAICREMEAHFRAGRFEQGLLEGIERISRHLEAHYPARGGANELPDQPLVI